METLDVEKTPDQIAQIERAMVAEGQSTHESAQADYFGFEETLRTFLPDGISYVEHQVLNEGQRRKYLNAVNREVRVQRASGDAFMKMSPGDERKALVEAAIVGWNFMRNGAPVQFSPKNLSEFLNQASPRIVDIIEKEIRKANPWLQNEMSVEDIDQEIATLQELRAKKVEDEEGKDGSGK